MTATPLIIDAADVELDTVVLGGGPTSLWSDAGALEVLHGALQSAIGDVDDAVDAEVAYLAALDHLESK